MSIETFLAMVSNLENLFAMVSNKILQEDEPVGWVYREGPDGPGDSGWRILSGNEDEDYLKDVEHVSIFPLSSVMELCPDLVPLLPSAVGTRLERGYGDMFFNADNGQPVSEPLIDDDWTFAVGAEFQCRFEDGSLIYWAPGRTIYLNIYNSQGLAGRQAIEAVLGERQRTPEEEFERVEDGLVSQAYLTSEQDGDRQYWGLNTLCADGGDLLCAYFYFDDITDMQWAVQTWKSIRRLG